MNDRILVVDDDPAARKILSMLLGATWVVLEASNGTEALLVAETERPRLMLLDMNMPGMSGLEVLKAALASGTGMSIIMLTSQNDVELAKKALTLGAMEYVTKPFDLARLKDRIRRCMQPDPKDDAKRGGLPWRTHDPGAL